jgi:hypothetical protein
MEHEPVRADRSRQLTLDLGYVVAEPSFRRKGLHFSGETRHTGLATAALWSDRSDTCGRYC